MSKNVTELLFEWGENRNRDALDDLLPLVYDELRALASVYLRNERSEHTLQPTALVHEAYLKLVDTRAVSFRNRAQFFALSAKIMRNILVNHAEAKRAQKRGGDWERIASETTIAAFTGVDLDVLALDEALTELAEFDNGKSQVVELKFFGGLTTEETAAALGKSVATVEREWMFARGWLYQKLQL